jgi:hypothetical protein
MGMAVSGNSLCVSSLCQIWRFENRLRPGEMYQDHDCLFVPQMSWITGDLDVYGLGLTDTNELIFVNLPYLS